MCKNALFFLLLLLLWNCNRPSTPPAGLTVGTIQHHADFPSEFVAARNVDIWLPPGYDNNLKQKYDILIMHDGQMLYDSTTTWNHQEWGVDEWMATLTEQHKIRPAIVIGVWNTSKRFAEYMPQKPAAALPDSLLNQLRSATNGDIQSDRYLLFLTKELLPFITKNYRVNTGKAHTFMMGSSMGGLISLYAICEYPDVFGGAACLSTHWSIGFDNQHPMLANTVIDYFGKHLPDPESHKIYFDHGTATLDSLYAPHQLRMDEWMQQRGYWQGQNWLSREFAGADHSEKSWRARLNLPLEFLLSK